MPSSRLMIVIGAIAAWLLSAATVAPTALAQADSFPDGDFFIRSVVSGLVVEIKDGSTAEGAPAVVRTGQSSNNDNQLWKYDQGFLVNKKSGLVLEVVGYQGGGNIEPGTPVAQASRRERPANLNQLWAYNRGRLVPYDPKVTLSVRDDNFADGNEVVVDGVRAEDPGQEWHIEPV